jgi:hypothetical protein
LYVLGWFPKADAARLGQKVRGSGGILLSATVTLVLTRNPVLAALAGLIAYWIGGSTKLWRSKAQGNGDGTVSTVRTAYIELSLDRATGAMWGRFLKGRFAGRALSELSAAERMDCLAELKTNDAQAARLYETYLERTAPGSDTGGGQSGGASRGMGAGEAYLVLGLNPGASRSEINAAHRDLIKRFHPDQGGTNYLAAKVNEAKDVLLRHTQA